LPIALINNRFFLIFILFFSSSCASHITNWSHKSGNNEKINKDLKDCKVNALKNISIPCTNPIECISQNITQVALVLGKYATHNEICMLNKGYTKDIYQEIFE
jgi:hypothetical protein